MKSHTNNSKQNVASRITNSPSPVVNSIAMNNDDFADAFLLTGLSDLDTGSNVGFTGEFGEPSPTFETNSAWWSWTAPADTQVTIDTLGSDFDTFLSVFIGNAVNDLTFVDQNDDFFGLISQVEFNATAGTTYHIAVDGFSNDQGNIALNLNAVEIERPPNDDFEDAFVLSGLFKDTDTGSNEFATVEMGEPSQSFEINFEINSVWWSWTAPISGEFSVDTLGSNYDTFLSVFTGDAVDNLTLVDSNDDTFGLLSQVMFDATAGTTYHIAVDGYFDEQGLINLKLIAEDDLNIIGTKLADTLHGGNGNDFIDGLNSNDVINGNNGNDFILGGNGADIIDGGDGTDIINGERGRDTLTGGADPDFFVYETTGNKIVNDTITDFTVGEDFIDVSLIFSNPNYDSGNPFEDYIRVEQMGDDAVVRINRNGNINKPRYVILATLENVDADSIGAADFILGTASAELPIGPPPIGTPPPIIITPQT